MNLTWGRSTEIKAECPEVVHNQYTERIDEPKIRRTVRNYLPKMEHYRLIRAEGQNCARTYRPR